MERKYYNGSYKGRGLVPRKLGQCPVAEPCGRVTKLHVQ